MEGTRTSELTDHEQTSLERIKACEAAGLSTTTFAPASGYSVRTTDNIKNTLVSNGDTQRKSDARFQRVVMTTPPVTDTPWQVTLPNGAMVSFSGSTDTRELSRVLSVISLLR